MGEKDFEVEVNESKRELLAALAFEEKRSAALALIANKAGNMADEKKYYVQSAVLWAAGQILTGGDFDASRDFDQEPTSV